MLITTKKIKAHAPCPQMLRRFQRLFGGRAAINEKNMRRWIGRKPELMIRSGIWFVVDNLLTAKQRKKFYKLWDAVPMNYVGSNIQMMRTVAIGDALLKAARS